MAKSRHSKAVNRKVAKEEVVVVVSEEKPVEEEAEEEVQSQQIEGKSSQEEEDEEDDEDEDEDDDDYDPTKKNVDENGSDLDAVDGEDDEDDNGNDEKVPDYSAIESSISQVRTRSQKLSSHNNKRVTHIGSFETDERGLVKQVRTSVDVNSIFEELKKGKVDWKSNNQSTTNQETNTTHTTNNEAGTSANGSLAPKKIKIETSYAFAGKLVTETKFVDEDSAEARAYLNSTASITVNDSKENKRNSSFVTVIRKVVKSEQEQELRIKLKRPSLIDNFMQTYGNKKQKLSTLEKSRLDWASFVDKRKIGDELKIHNKAGFLDTQDFLHRVDARRDEQYLKAKEDERQRQFLLNGGQNSN